MNLNKIYAIERESCVDALEEIADLFLTERIDRDNRLFFYEKVTFKGFISGKSTTDTKEKVPLHYWFGGSKEDKMVCAFQTLAGNNAYTLIHILKAASDILKTGQHYYESTCQDRFQVEGLVSAHRRIFHYEKFGEEQLEVNLFGGQGCWHFRFEHNKGMHRVHFANNWGDKPNEDFEHLYYLLFGNIYEKHGGRVIRNEYY